MAQGSFVNEKLFKYIHGALLRLVGVARRINEIYQNRVISRGGPNQAPILPEVYVASLSKLAAFASDRAGLTLSNYEKQELLLTPLQRAINQLQVRKTQYANNRTNLASDEMHQLMEQALTGLEEIQFMANKLEVPKTVRTEENVTLANINTNVVKMIGSVLGQLNKMY